MNRQDTDKIVEFVQKLGFSAEAAKVYRVLVMRGPLTLLELSREAGIERTALYRQVPSWVAQGLLEELLAYKSHRYGAAEMAQLSKRVVEEKKRVDELEKNLPELERILGEMTSKQKTQVRYYRGVEGIKQIMWNETKARRELLGYTYRNMEEIAGVKFFKEWVAEIEKRGIVSRDLRSDEFMASMKIPSYEHVHIGKSSWRYLPESVMKLSHNLDIYNNVVAIYYWEENDVFGVEIENEKMAETQRSIWRTMWGLAETYELPKKYKRFERKIG